MARRGSVLEQGDEVWSSFEVNKGGRAHHRVGSTVVYGQAGGGAGEGP
jgi:hypothetical protein